MVAPRKLTTAVPLADGQGRLKQLVLYVAEECRDAPYFGLTKLNKIIWRADFTSFADRGVPITGRPYQRLQFGPAPIEMLPLLNELQRGGDIEYLETEFGDEIAEKRVIARTRPNVNVFLVADLRFVDRAISYYWDKTGTEASDDSHGLAWKTRNNKDSMPYELAYLSDRPIEGKQLSRLSKLALERDWKSN